MSEDESFVILGSSPTPSMDRYDGGSLNGGQRGPSTPNPSIPSHGGSITAQNGNRGSDIPMNGLSTPLTQSTALDLGQFSLISMVASNGPNSVPVVAAQPGASERKDDAQQRDASLASQSSAANATKASTSNGVGVSVGQFMLGETNGYDSSASVNPLNGMMNSGFASRISGRSVNANPASVKELLAEAAADESIKASLVNTFPSLFTSQSTDEDMKKLGALMCEHLELKANLEKTNTVMRSHLNTINQFHSSIKMFKQKKAEEEITYKEEISKLKDEVIALNKELIDKNVQYEFSQKSAEQEHLELVQLKDEVIALKKELSDKNVLYELSQKSAEQDHLELVQELSHRKSVIMNMSDQISKLELNANSFEMLSASPTTSSLSAPAQPVVVDVLPDMASAWKTTHENDVKTIAELTRKLAVSAGDRNQVVELRSVVHNQTVHAEQMQKQITSLTNELANAREQLKTMKETKSVYIDQVECLQANLKTTETQLQQANAEIALLNRKQTDFHEHLKERDARIGGLLAEVDLMNQQMEIYKTDFELERTSRQELASEREEILSDLKLLQRRNEELFNASQGKSVPGPSRSTSQPNEPAAGGAAGEKMYICPVCNIKLPKYEELERHVEACLK